MTASPLNFAQAKLVAGLRSTGPARWALKSAVTQHSRMLREVMVAFMTEHLTFKLTTNEAEKIKGLVVCPSANMHFWWAAGWQGPVVTSVQFMKNDAPAEHFDCVLFDVQGDYPAKYIERLDAFLEDPNAPTAVLWLPELPGDDAAGAEAPAWASPLMATLAKHRFVTLKIN